MGLDVAGSARIVVVAPGAADLTALFENGEVCDAGLLETDSHSQSAKPAADDHDVLGVHGETFAR